jgi:hypothetical protein
MNALHTLVSRRSSTRRGFALCVMAIVAWALFVTQRWFVEPLGLRSDALATHAFRSNAESSVDAFVSGLTASRNTQDSLQRIQQRWDSLWQVDATAAETNVRHLQSALSLIERAERGDLEATLDLMGAATWCLSAGPMTNVADVVDATETRGNARVPCYERFGGDLASRERLERASFGWLMQLVNAGLEDAALYASALTRGIGADVLGGVNDEPEIRDMQRAQIMGQLHSIALRGSADAASELNGHYGGDSYLTRPNAALAAFYARLTETLDPARALVARADP